MDRNEYNKKRRARYALIKTASNRRRRAEYGAPQSDVTALRSALKEAKAREAFLLGRIDDLKTKPKLAKPVRLKKPKAAKHIIRVVIPDFHGEHIDHTAAAACLADVAALRPEQVIYLGDGLDCAGTFSAHQRSYTHEMTESLTADAAAANWFLDSMRIAAPNSEDDYIEGNHEHHVERWTVREFPSHHDAKFVLDRLGPEALLNLKARGIRYFRQGEMHDNLNVRGTIKRGKCYFTHGMSHAKHAADVHLRYVGSNVVFGHVHRVQSIGERNVQSDGYGAWCPGTLAKLQPLYRHTTPTSWQHGYGVQFVNTSTGTFVHFNVPIANGASLLHSAIEVFKGRAA